MDYLSRYEPSRNFTTMRSSSNHSNHQFLETFHPLSYNQQNDFRPLETKFYEDISFRDKRPYEFRSRTSIDTTHNTSGAYYRPESFSTHSEKILKLEQAIYSKDSVIDELKIQKSALNKEIEELVMRSKESEQQRELEKNDLLSKIEDFKYNLKESDDAIRNLQQEVCEYRESCKVLEERIAKSESDFDAVLKENNELRIKAEQNSKRFDPKSEFIISKLNEQIKQLKEDNENLSISLNTRPTAKDIKEKDYIITELKDKINKNNSRSRSMSHSHNHNHQSIQKDKELFSMSFGETPSSSTMNMVLTDILHTLKLKDHSQIIPKIKSLKIKHKTNDLEKRVANLVKDLSPEGSFHPLPTPQQSWKWIIRVIEEYLSLKRDLEKEEKNKVIINRLLGSLGVSDSSQIIKEVNSLIGESHANKALLEKLDLMLDSDPNSLLKDYKYLVNELL